MASGLIALVTALAVSAVGTFAAAAIAERFAFSSDPDRRAIERTLAAGLALAAIFVGVATVAGTVGFLNRPWLVFAGVGLVAVAVRPSATHVRDLFLAWRDVSRECLCLREGGLLARATFFVLVSAASLLWAKAFLSPPNAWDALTYHLTYPLHWLREGVLETFGFGVGETALEFFPMAGELLFYFGFATTTTDMWTDVAQLPAFFLSLVAVFGISRELGGSREDSSQAALLWGALPLVLHSIFEAMVDLFLSAFVLSGVYFALRSTAQPSRNSSILATFAAFGLACGTKYVGALYVAMIAPFVLVLLRGTPRGGRGSSIPILLGGSLLALACGGYAYIRNTWVGGNPVLPMEVHLGPWTLFPGPSSSSSFYESRDRDLTWLGFLASPRAILDLGLTHWPALLAPLLALGALRADPGRRRQIVCLLGMALACWFAYFVVLPYRLNRFLLVPIALSATLTVLWPERLRRVLIAFLWVATPSALFYLAKDVALLGVDTSTFLVLGFGALGGALTMLLVSGSKNRVLVALGLIAILTISTDPLYRARRFESWESHWGTRYDSGPPPRHLTEFAEISKAWSVLATHTEELPSTTVAFSGTNLVYPLAGRELRHRVLHVPSDAPADEVFLRWNRRDLDRSVEGNADTWVANLRALEVGFVVAYRRAPENDPTASFPDEANWAGERPETFEKIHTSDHVQIFATHWEAPSKRR